MFAFSDRPKCLSLSLLPLIALAPLFQARSLLYQFRLLPRIPCSLHDLCKLCGPGMWDSRYIPTVECSGEHPDSLSCPYGGTSTPQPSSPSPSSSPNHTPTPDGKRGSKKRDIFTFRKQSWGVITLLLVSLSTTRYFFLFFFCSWTFHLVQCWTLPYQGVAVDVQHRMILQRGQLAVRRIGGQEAAFSSEQNRQSPGAVSIWSHFRFKSAAGLAFFHKICGHRGGHRGVITQLCSQTLMGQKANWGRLSQNLNLDSWKMFLGSHNGIIVWMSNIMCIFRVWESFWPRIQTLCVKEVEKKHLSLAFVFQNKWMFLF